MPNLSVKCLPSMHGSLSSSPVNTSDFLNVCVDRNIIKLILKRQHLQNAYSSPLPTVLARKKNLCSKVLSNISILVLNKNSLISHIHLKLKGKIYKTIIRPAAFYGSEYWATKGKKEGQLLAAEIPMLRSMCCVTRLDRIRNDYIRGSTRVAPVTEKIKRTRWS